MQIAGAVAAAAAITLACGTEPGASSPVAATQTGAIVPVSEQPAKTPLASPGEPLSRDTAGSSATSSIATADPDATPITPEEAIRQDTQNYADRVGIEYEEATRRLDLSSAISELQKSLRQSEPSSFGGLYVEHEPQYRVIVQFTRDPEETLSRYVSGGPLDGVAVAKQVGVTEARLRQAQFEAMRVLQELGVEHNSSVDIKTGQVQLYVADPGETISKVRDAGVELPSEAVLVGPTGATQTADG